MKALLVTVAVLALWGGAPARAEMTDDMAAIAARQMYVEGRYDEAVAALRPLADRGVPRAMAILGFLYELGLGVAQDDAQAVAWYEKAAAAGSPVGIHNLARSYEMGELGLAQDPARARGLYEQAAAMDYGGSLHNLGRMMIYGEGGPQDAVLGRAYLERAVALGNPDATADMAYMLATGDGLPVDPVRARQLYEIGAAHRIDWAVRDYADMLETGTGGPADLTQAWAYYEIAAGLDYAMAGMDLAEMVWANPDALSGHTQDALAWCYWAEAQPPDSDGNDYDGRCAAQEAGYTPDQIAAAKERAAGL